MQSTSHFVLATCAILLLTATPVLVGVPLTVATMAHGHTYRFVCDGLGSEDPQLRSISSSSRQLRHVREFEDRPVRVSL